MGAASTDVFLSYSRADAPAVRQIQAYLKQAGLATFLDRDQLPAGQPWLSALEQAIARCAPAAPSRSSPSSYQRSRIRPVASCVCRPGSISAPTSPTPLSSSYC